MPSQNRVVHASRGDQSLPQSQPSINLAVTADADELLKLAERCAARHGTKPVAELVRIIALRQHSVVGEACMQAVALGWCHV